MFDILFLFLFLISVLQVDLLRENLSVAIAVSPYGLLIRIFMIILSLYLLYVSFPHTKDLKRPKLGKGILITACLLMIIGMMFTYHKDVHDLTSSLHLYLTLSSVVLYFLYDGFYTAELFLTNVKKATRLRMILMTGITMVMIVMFTFGAINGLGEFLALATLLTFRKVLEQ